MKVYKSDISLDNIKNSKRTRKRVDYCDKIENDKQKKISKNDEDDDSDFEIPKSKLNSSHLKSTNNRKTNRKNQTSKPHLSENDAEENIPLKILSRGLKNCPEEINNHVSRPDLSEDESSDSDNEQITFRSVPDNLLKEPFGEICANEDASCSQKINVEELDPQETIKEDEKISTGECKEATSESRTFSKRKSDSKLDFPKNKRQKMIEKKTNHGKEKAKKKSKKNSSKERPLKMSELLKNENLDVGFSSDAASGSDWEDVNGKFIYNYFTFYLLERNLKISQQEIKNM